MSDITEKATDALYAVPHPEPAQVPQNLSKRFVVALVLLFLGVYVAAVGLSIVAWPITVAALKPDDKVFWLSIVTGLYALVNVVITPISGALSDRCTSRFGMRRPFIVIGVAFSVLGLLIMALSSGIAQLMVGVVFQGIGNATVTGASGALVPDQVPERHRGKVQGLMMVCIAISGVIASVFFPLFIGDQFVLFTIPAAIMLVAAVVVSIILRDRRLSRAERDLMERPKNFFAEFKIKPSTVPDYSWAWISKLIVVLGTVLTSTYGIYVLTDQLKVAPDKLPGIITMTGLIGLATAIGGAVLGSWVGDRFRIRKALVFWTTVLIAAGAVVVAFSPSVPIYLVGLALMGVGAGAYSPIDGALFIDVLPGEGQESGKFMSLMTVADQIPRSFGPILGSGIVVIAGLASIGGFTLVYLVGALAALFGGVLVRKIKGSV